MWRRLCVFPVRTGWTVKCDHHEASGAGCGVIDDESK